MQHTDSVDAPLMHAALGRWPALNADTGDTGIIGWTACAEKSTAGGTPVGTSTEEHSLGRDLLIAPTVERR